MPDPALTSFDWILKAWPAGAAVAGVSVIAWFWVKQVLPALFVLLKDRREAISKLAAADKAVEVAARQAELDAEIRIAESKQAATIALSALGAEMKQTAAFQATITSDLKALMADAERLMDKLHIAAGHAV